MSRTKFCIMAVVTLATFGFAVYVHSSDRLVRGIVIEKSEIPEHYETIDKGVLLSISSLFRFAIERKRLLLIG